MAVATMAIHPHKGRIIVNTKPIPSAIKNNPIVFLKAPNNILIPPLTKAFKYYRILLYIMFLILVGDKK